MPALRPEVVTCGTCRFKGEPIRIVNDLGDEQPTRFFLCGLIKHCGQEHDVQHSDAPATVVDGSGYYAALCVAEDFGCNRWAPKA